MCTKRLSDADSYGIVDDSCNDNVYCIVVENQVGQPGDWLTQMVIVNDSCNAKVHVTFWFAPNNYKFEKYVITILEEGQGTCRPGKCEKDKNHVSVI